MYFQLVSTCWGNLAGCCPMPVLILHDCPSIAWMDPGRWVIAHFLAAIALTGCSDFILQAMNLGEWTLLSVSPHFNSGSMQKEFEMQCAWEYWRFSEEKAFAIKGHKENRALGGHREVAKSLILQTRISIKFSILQMCFKLKTNNYAHKPVSYTHLTLPTSSYV